MGSLKIHVSLLILGCDNERTEIVLSRFLSFSVNIPFEDFEKKTAEFNDQRIGHLEVYSL